MSKEALMRWSGFSWILAGILIALAALIHPSKETVQTILAQEFRLVTAHWLFTFFCGFFLLGLPGIYASHARKMGRLGLAAFLMLFFGTLFFAISNDYGFNAPVLARQAPQTLDAINSYPPVAFMDALFVLLLLPGSILFGIAIWRLHVLPPWVGILIPTGWNLFIFGGGLSQLIFEPLWILAILGTVLFGLGLGWCGYVFGLGKEEVVHLQNGENPAQQ